MVILGLGAGALAYAVVSDDGGGGRPQRPRPPGGTSPAPARCPPETGTTGGRCRPTPRSRRRRAPPGRPGTGFDTVTGAAGLDPVHQPAPPRTHRHHGTEHDDRHARRHSGRLGLAGRARAAGRRSSSSVRSESAARAAKSQAPSDGQPAGVLFSSDYSGLRPGYWVVFSGVYDARARRSRRPPSCAASSRAPTPADRRLSRDGRDRVVPRSPGALERDRRRPPRAPRRPRATCWCRRAVRPTGWRRCRTRSAPDGSLAVACDVTDWDAQQALAAAALAAFGRHRRGVRQRGLRREARLPRASRPSTGARWSLTNVYGAALTVRACIDELRDLARPPAPDRLGGGAHGGAPGRSTRARSGPWRAMAEAARQDLHGSGVRVTLISPGTVETPFYDVAGRRRAAHRRRRGATVMFAMRASRPTWTSTRSSCGPRSRTADLAASALRGAYARQSPADRLAPMRVRSPGPPPRSAPRRRAHAP